MLDLSRVEQKYLITETERIKTVAYFRCFLHEDEHNGIDGYRVRSLYFDTPLNQDYCDKENGIEYRKKIRLRCYHLDQAGAWLEMKQKQGNAQRKRSLFLEREDVKSLCQGDYHCLLKYPDAFALECYVLMTTEVYRPKVIIEYKRIAFVTEENRTRVTFDFDVQACEGFYDLFSLQAPLHPILDPILAIVEVKYTGFLLSYVQDAIQRINRSTIAMSKYALSRNLLI